MCEDCKSCSKCKWFEERTGFCRKNPPVPAPQYIKGVGYVTTSSFPKVTFPNLDWCSFFEALTDQELL